MSRTERVMKWLESVHSFEIEKEILEKRIDDIEDSRSPRARGTPDPEVQGGRSSVKSNPTEQKAIDFICSRNQEKIHEALKRIRLIEETIEGIKTQTELIYYESDMRAEWYQAICYYYFDHMSIGEISKEVGYEMSTIKKHKARGILVLVKNLPQNLY